jgi:hypothetical protein
LKQKGAEFGGQLRDKFNNLKANVIVQGLTPEQQNPSSIATQTKDTPNTANTSFTSEAKQDLTKASVGGDGAKQAIIAKKKVEVSNNIANAGDVPFTLDISADLDRQLSEINTIAEDMQRQFDSDRFFGAPTNSRSVVAKAGDALHVTEGNYFQGSVGTAIDGFRHSDSLVEKTIFGVLGAFAAVPAVAEIVANGIYNTPSRIAHGLDSMSYNAQNLMSAPTFDNGVIAGLGLVRDTSFEILDLASLGGLGAARAGIAGSLVSGAERSGVASGTSNVKNVFHATSDSAVNPIIEGGFRIDIPNPQAAFHNNRFGSGVYVSDSPAAALAERANSTVLNVEADFGVNLNITTRGPIYDADLAKSIARGARKHGYDSITTQSVQKNGGINTIVFDATKVRATGVNQ